MPSLTKTVLRNTLAQLIAKAIAVTLTLLSTLYIIRLGGTDLFGELTKALALITIGFSAVDFGLNAHAVRSMRGSPSSQREVFGNTLLARLLLSLVTVLALNLLVLILPGGYSGEIGRVFWVGSLSILFQGIYASGNAWFQRHLSYGKSALAVIVGTSFGTLLTLYISFTHPTLFGLLLASTCGYFLMGALTLFLLRHHLPTSLSFSGALSHLKSSSTLGIILLLSILVSKLDTIILGVFRPSFEVGEYGFAYRVFDVAIVLPVFVMNAVYPLLVTTQQSLKHTLANRSTQALLILGTLAAALLFPLAPLIYLVKPGMHLAVTSFRLLALALPLFYLTAPLMWQLIEAKLEKHLLHLYLIAGIVNGLANLIFTPLLGPPSAAIITGLTELLILLGLLYIKRRYV